MTILSPPSLILLFLPSKGSRFYLTAIRAALEIINSNLMKLVANRASIYIYVIYYVAKVEMKVMDDKNLYEADLKSDTHRV